MLNVRLGKEVHGDEHDPAIFRNLFIAIFLLPGRLLNVRRGTPQECSQAAAAIAPKASHQYTARGNEVHGTSEAKEQGLGPKPGPQ